MSQKLQTNQYKTPDAWVSDCRLVFRNCYAYNKMGTEIWNMAEKLSKTFEQKLLVLQGGTVRARAFFLSFVMLICVLWAVGAQAAARS